MARNPNSVPTDFFDTDNCNLFSQLIPEKQKRWLKDFVSGNLLRNPIEKASELIFKKFPGLDQKIGNLLGITTPGSGLYQGLESMNKALEKANIQLVKFNQHASRLSGLTTQDGLASFQEIFGVMQAYNSIKHTLQDIEGVVEDNFSNAFSALKPNVSGPVLSNMYDNLDEITNLLDVIAAQLNAGGLVNTARFVKELANLTKNLQAITGNLETIINNDNGYFAMALAFVERYGLGNTLISSAIIDPCFGARIVRNYILQPNAAKSLDEIAIENGVNIEDSPVQVLDYLKFSKNADALKIDL
jgi:hypothetical protein